MAVDYKYKPDKHKCQTGIRTIDEIHNEYITKFKNDVDSMPQKKTQMKAVEDELNEIMKYSKENPLNMNIEKLKRKTFLQNEITRLSREINEIETHSNEMEYFGKIVDVVYDYYDLTNGKFYNNTFDKQKDKPHQQLLPAAPTNKINEIDISDELYQLTVANKTKKIKRPVKKRNKKNGETNRKSIMSYLTNENDEQIKNDDSNIQSRATLEKEYMTIIDKDTFNKTKLTINKKCEKCGTSMVIIYSESLLCCPNAQCGEAETIFIEYEVPSQKDSFNEKPKYPYRRIGHCIEKLNQFQSKGSTNVPPSVFRILDEEIKKHNLQKVEITMNFLEKMLKKHKLSNHYENIMYIYCQITETPPMTLTRGEIDLVISMFLKAEELYYTKYKPPDRDNFLKYSFTLHKIFMTIGKEQYAKCFKLLKSHWKMKQQETIWKNICEDAGWPYYPT